MTSEELAVEVGKVHAEALSRILLQGDASYAMIFEELGQSRPEVRQRFEHESLEDNLTGLEEELIDTINWAAMAVLKLRARRARAEADRHTS